MSRAPAVETAIHQLARAPATARGAIQTRPEVAAFVLDLAGYQVDRSLHHLRLLEPSFGDGAFVLEAARRLLSTWRDTNNGDAVTSLGDAIRAVEIHEATYSATRTALYQLLTENGIQPSAADALLNRWLVCDDFLLTPLAEPFDVVVGNPPYIRQEAIAPALVERYRKDYRSIYDRADIYVPFIERGLQLLRQGGRLTYICADRWMKNKYGGPLRGIVAEGFALRHVVEMHQADAFDGEVDAYPSVFTIERVRRDRQKPPVALAANPEIDSKTLVRLARHLNEGEQSESVHLVKSIVSGTRPWVTETHSATVVLRSLEDRYPTLQGAKCHVGIGVATGADRVFIAQRDALPIEDDRILPLAMARDVRDDGTVQWSGKVLANPFGPDGRLVDLDRYPRLKQYFETHGDQLRKRHTAKKSPARWYRTIDKVHADLTSSPKLLIPDIKGRATVAYDEGTLYPHHNLYYVTSEAWDLRALQAVLRSRIAEFQVAAYAVRMRGGYLRFQAQYLRRVHIPMWAEVSRKHRQQLAEASTASRETCDAVVRDLYGLHANEWDEIVEMLGDR